MAAEPTVAPEFQAGGGNSSAFASPKTVETFSPLVLRHLKSIYGRLSSQSHNVTATEASASPHRALWQHDDGPAPPELPGVGVDFNGFLTYASSSAFDALAPPISSSLSYPMSNYFICSSHNTYLTGNQLYGQSSTDGYKNVLLRGCRCIEIDVWDGEERDLEEEGKESKESDQKHRFRPNMRSKLASIKGARDSLRRDDAHGPPAGSSKGESLEKITPWTSSTTLAQAEPRVLHGGSNQYTKSKFSDLPVIVSLEVHASLEQQQIMVDIMHTVWKGLMVDDAEKEFEKELPSPAALQKRILVKVKHASSENSNENEVLLAMPPPERIRSASTSSSDEDNSKKGVKKKSKVLASLGRLGIYTSSYHFSSFSQPEAKVPSHVFSLSEGALMKQHEENSIALFTHNRNFLMRAYPKGLRVSSSNLDPAVFWRKGVQMVALNWQKWDQGMMLNEAMFAGQGGWVLKPEGYRGLRDSMTASVGQAEAIKHRTLNMTIQVFAAQDLPLPIGDEKTRKFHPYIKCELHVEEPEERSGEPIENGGKSKEGEHKAKTKTQKGSDPDFGGEIIQFSRIKGVVDELSFLRLKILDDDKLGRDDLAAWACIRLDRLRQGYRFVRLFDARGAETVSVLLIKVTKTFC
ncbi:MAG: hypothetical protein M4579_000718 [Chaenotheca gracillima]|nr:MAG: hypothetical protein M4579_000718 [Chaenotheca gracillima]